MCGGMPVQLGIPLNDAALNSMTAWERGFWADFLEEAEQVIDKMEKENATQPYTPPGSLREKYWMAVVNHNGRIYCQVRQLEGIFSF